MPASVTVWCVEIGADALPEDVKGSLALTSDALVFTPRADRPERRYPLREIAQARRLRGSPVLMVAREAPEGLRRTAFYFVQPPPLDRPDIPARPSPMGLGRNTTRKARRQNVSYLGMWNREKKALLREWERQVKRAVAAARP